MNKLKLVGLFVGGLVEGAIATGWWSGHVYSRLIVSKEADTAFRAAEEAEWLALLRLNEPKTVIEQLENSMDITVLTLAQWDEVKSPDEKTRTARDRFLVPVKVYHESYPPSGNDAARSKSFIMKRREVSCKDSLADKGKRHAKVECVDRSPFASSFLSCYI